MWLSRCFSSGVGLLSKCRGLTCAFKYLLQAPSPSRPLPNCLRSFRSVRWEFARSLSSEMSEEEDVIRMRGMPWSATPEEVIQFLSPAKVKGGKDGVHFTLSREGRPSGEAYVEMETKEDAKKALEKDHKNMGHRYIEVYTTKRNEMDWTLKRQYGGPNYQQDGCVRLRGLPFGCTKEEVANFFAGLEIVPNGINLVADYTGRATGEAYVQFANDDIAEKALKKHKECIGPRYIEIFRSNLSELKAAVGPKMRSPLAFPNRPAPYDTGNRFGGMNRFGERGGGMVGGGMPRGPMRPNMGGPPMRGGGGYSDYDNGWGPGGRDSSRMEPWGPGPRDRMEPYGMGPGPAGPGGPGPAGKDWDDDGPRGPGGKEHIVHMRGLPFRATEADIADFFKPLVPVFIDIDYEKSGRPSGKADVGFASHEEAAKAVARDKEQMGHRYIELFLDSTPERGNPRPGNMGRGLDDRDMGMPMNPAPNRNIGGWKSFGGPPGPGPTGPGLGGAGMGGGGRLWDDSPIDKGPGMGGGPGGYSGGGGGNRGYGGGFNY